MTKTSNIYVIQKFVKANSLGEALKKESKAVIVDVSLAISEPNKPLTQAVGFMLRPDGQENIDYE